MFFVIRLAICYRPLPFQKILMSHRSPHKISPLNELNPVQVLQ